MHISFSESSEDTLDTCKHLCISLEQISYVTTVQLSEVGNFNILYHI